MLNIKDINRSGEMEVFTRVVAAGTFSEAARQLDMSPSAVSKLIARLEQRLGARLLHRSTRRLELTAEGERFNSECLRILEQIDNAERDVANVTRPSGLIQVNANLPFGLHCLLPLLPDFLAAYPDITLNVELTDTVVDLLERRADVAIRTGPMKESSLVQRRLGESRLITVAAPSYIARFGKPESLEALHGHNRLSFGFHRYSQAWVFRGDEGQRIEIEPQGNILLSDGESMRQSALAGLGIARLANFHIGADIEAGRLVPLLQAWDSGESEAIHAVFIGPGRQLPHRVRVFIDFLLERIAPRLSQD
ncbi:LysR family transcriptional regulator [Pseudomonas gingeri]|uniref:LysR family transcriptional regulator n=1 Tax=Pseudomonas gingeri TaxID=117681 RepID=A0A7Y7YAX5_9PSED|nr:LysR family transcriptional regulator [Pseudomonas gingeri]NVZ99073.1 LysR family transcriptional regulator [Pseudomonas gingeri]NWA13118.1 LysR family transcriptional regulator [Pseudomonas gingeri]NWA55379.1 LysR family transcriptional regulator [Pseudomonas gingeri]NWA95767.1 LysR family transcriptional regulator [Pseudomonas gingeri]NWB00855.1 LysR family transcriptional regulator [Pseudomonas gingeri]